MSKCSDCSLHKDCMNSLIMGRGAPPKKTEVMVIQEFPSRFDDKNNTVLTGDTRAKMNYFLEKAGIPFSKVYFTSAVKCKVKTASDIKPKHIIECQKYLFREILNHKPKIIIPMGKAAYMAVSDKKSIREFRGHFDEFEIDEELDVNGKSVIKNFKCKIMPTFSLLGSLRKWEYNTDILSDLRKAYNYVENDEIPMTDLPVVNTILTKQGLKDFAEKMREVKYATTDFETTGFDFWRHRVINAGYCSEDKKADVIFLEPYKKEHIAKWTKKEIERAKEINSFLKHNRNYCIKTLKTVNDFDHLKLILHNGKFDSKFARHNGIPFRNFWFDTLRADPLIDENLGHALNIAMERRGINFGPYDTKLWKYTNKDEKKKKSYQFIPPPMLELYLGIDVYGDWLLWKKQTKELKKEGMTDFFFKTAMPAVHDIEKMEYKGIRYSRKKLLKTADIISKKQDKLQQEIVKETGIEDPKFSNSPKQIVTYMMDAGFPFKKLKIKSNKTGYSTGKDELLKFTKYKKWQTLPKLLLDAKKLTKIRGTYVDGKDGKGGFLQYMDEFNRIHGNFNLWSPRTSRYSSSSPSLQVFPRPIKGLPNTRSFVIPTNRRWGLFEADYSALEINIVASLSSDKTLIKELREGVDLHCANAVELGRVLKNIPSWITYEVMLEANGKGHLIKDPDLLKDIQKDIEKHGKDVDFKELRTRAKNLGFGLNYGKSYITFASDFKIAEEDAEDMVDAYFDKYHGVFKWRTGIVSEAHEKGFISLVSGRKRRFGAAMDWINNDFSDGIWSAGFLKEEIARQAMNTPVQGGAHEIFEPACIRLNKRFKTEEMRARLLLSIHDGIVGECPLEERKLVHKVLHEEMPHTFNKGTKLEINLRVDTDFYEYEWYGNKIKHCDL